MTALAPPSPESGTPWTPSRTRWLVAAIAVLAGLLATIDGPAPTGDPSVDFVIVAVAVAGVTWLGAAALRWDAAVIVLVAGVLTASWTGALIGVTVTAVGFVVPVRPGLRGVVNATLIGVAFNLAARSELDVFLGASALVAVALAGYVGTIGFLRRTKRSRQVVAGIVGAAGAVAFVVTFTGGVFGYLAVDDLRAGNDLTAQGLDALGRGDLAAAGTAFSAAAESFAAADERLDTPLVAGARFVPVVAQHHRAITDLSGEAADAARLIAVELEQVDLSALRVEGGSIDLDAIRELQTPLTAIDQRIASLQATIARLDSPWLSMPVADRLDRLGASVAEQRQRSADALSAAVAAPDLLGGQGRRTYFVGFTTPAEARGSGGFMGNWAEITVTDGHLEMTRFGRVDDLNAGGDPAVRRFPTDDDTSDEPSDDDTFDQWLARYGPFHLANGDGGTTGEEPWKNINMSPDMAMTGRAIAALYPQSGGGELDGVFVMDVYALARLLQFTGPITLAENARIDGGSAEGPPTVDADTAADFLLNGQYDVTETGERVDVLEAFSTAVVEALLAGSLPPPDELVDVLGPMVDQGRIAAWMSRPDEQRVIARLGLAGTLPEPTDDDALAIVFNNAVGNKIDYYLAAEASYAVEADSRSGRASATLTLTMTNGAPVDGEPNYVIGNPIGLPTGTNRTWVSIFSRLPVTAVTADGETLRTEPGAEAGYFVTSSFVTLPAGESVTLHVEMSGPIDVLDRYELRARTPPTVAPTPLAVDATWIDGDGAARASRHVFDAAGSHTFAVDDDTPVDGAAGLDRPDDAAAD